ncbi:MAG: DUF4286 family protein [Muribaculaceae bacterium]|nr:DUF4286 family protein [Muribaculaceae bacterium]
MFIVNTTFHVENSLLDEFLIWVKDIYIPEAVASGLLNSPVLNRILVEVDPAATGYAVQFCADTIEHASLWHDEQGAELRGQLMRRWPQQIVFFTTYMEIIPL